MNMPRPEAQSGFLLLIGCIIFCGMIILLFLKVEALLLIILF